MNEEWRAVVGFEGAYEVSNLGNVRSLDRFVDYKKRCQYSGKILEISKWVLGVNLRPAPGTSGHLSVVLGRNKTRQVHSLVIEAFVGPRPLKHECCHSNGICTDNRAENLRWGTRHENIVDAFKHGGRQRGENSTYAKLKQHQVEEIRSLLPNLSAPKIAKMFGVSAGAIYSIKYGHNWKDRGNASSFR